MERPNAHSRSVHPSRRAPPVVVSLAFAVGFAALVTTALVAVTMPTLAGAFLAGALTPPVVHVVRSRVAAARPDDSPVSDTGHAPV